MSSKRFEYLLRDLPEPVAELMMNIEEDYNRFLENTGTYVTVRQEKRVSFRHWLPRLESDIVFLQVDATIPSRIAPIVRIRDPRVTSPDNIIEILINRTLYRDFQPAFVEAFESTRTGYDIRAWEIS